MNALLHSPNILLANRWELRTNALLHSSNDWPIGESYGRALCCTVQTTGQSLRFTGEHFAAQMLSVDGVSNRVSRGSIVRSVV